MTLDQLLNKWGYSFSFIATAVSDGNDTYQYGVSYLQLSEIESFTRDIEEHLNTLLNADIIGGLTGGNLYPLIFKASVKEKIKYQISKELSDIFKSANEESTIFSANFKIEQLFENKDLWEEYAIAERDFTMIGNYGKEVTAISIKVKQSGFIGRNIISSQETWNETSRLYDYKVTFQTNILVGLIKQYLDNQTITALGVLQRKGETTVEIIETPAIGNWKTVIEEDGSSTFTELENDEIIQEMKDLMDPQVGKDYHSYSIQEVGNNIRVETTPFDKEPFDVKIEDIKLEIRVETTPFDKEPFDVKIEDIKLEE